MNFKGKAIWVTWHEHRRTRSLVRWLELPVFVYDDHRPLQRNIVGPLWTLGVLLKQKPDVVFTHFSFLLQLMIMVYKYLFRFGRVKVISDCHNKALKREIDGPLASAFLWFKSLLFQGVDLIVVTNETLVPLAEKLCPKAGILRDPLTDWEGQDHQVRQEAGEVQGGHVFFVCSFDKDEPVDLIFESAHVITQMLKRQVVISGRIPEEKMPEKIRNNPDVLLPGFMPIKQYQDTLFMAAAVVVLTEDDDCLVCGAYESLGASRPTVLSATPSLKACFGGSAVYAAHNVDDIVDQVASVMDSKVDPMETRRTFEQSWKTEWNKLQEVLGSIPGILH